jgi:uncharacterized protein
MMPYTAGVALTALLLTGCAAPPLRFYTLGSAPAIAHSLFSPGQITVIEVDRLILPNYLDSQNIWLRNGCILQGSSTGRWVTRLSLLATDLVTTRLATRAPHDLVTEDQGLGEAPQYRISIRVSRLDVTKNGRASMDADWQILPNDRDRRSTEGRAQIRLAGSTATDVDTVRLESTMFERLADAISLPAARFLDRKHPAAN